MLLLGLARPAPAAGKRAQDKGAATQQAQEQAAAQQAQEKAARKACLSGDYGKGVDLLAELFVDTKDPTYVFNQGRCFEQNRKYEDAIARFQEFLRAGHGKLDANDKAEAEQHIADCKQMLAQERASSATPTVPQPFVASPRPAAPPAGATEPPSTVTEPATPARAASTGAGLRKGGIVAASVGVAAAAAGLVFNLKANSTVDDMYGAVDGYSKESRRNTYESLAWVGYGVGAACVAAGVVLYTLGVRARSRSAGNVALVPTLQADRAGAALVGAF